MKTTSSSTASTHDVSLQAFSQATQAGDAVYVSTSTQAPQVLGTKPVAKGHQASQIAATVDTVSIFTQALARSYGDGIAKAISRELALAPSPGRPLSSWKIERALEMAQTSLQALEGIDFATRLSCLASSNAPVFLSVCAELDINPNTIDTQKRHQIDNLMQARFSQAASAGLSPVSIDTARHWLHQLIHPS